MNNKIIMHSMKILHNANNQILDGFWNGFQEINGHGPMPLASTPEYVNTVTLAFAGTAPGNSLTTNYLCKYYDSQTIIGWARQLQAKGQRVLMSIIDNTATHWNQIDVSVFVKSA